MFLFRLTSMTVANNHVKQSYTLNSLNNQLDYHALKSRR